jgi:dihydroorotate dehydrogenase electron transfer subunit
MAKKVEDFKVVDNKYITEDFFVLEVESMTSLPEMKPGQFVQVKVEGRQETFLRRPISIHDVDYKRNRMSLLIQILGKGTECLSKLKPGELINIVYPLGNSFSIPEKDENVILIGGGCGIAPLLYLGKNLKINGFKPVFILGFRNSSRIIEYDKYLEIGEVFLTTEDGSKGEKGYVTNHSVLTSRKFDRVYCCGPDSMMKAVALYSQKNNISCEVSLENLMACGFGICLCCIVDTVRGNLCTCTEGPVFNINELKW